SDNFSDIYDLLRICETHSINWKYRFNPNKCKITVNNIHEKLNEITNTVSNNVNTVDCIQQEFIDNIPDRFKNKLPITSLAPLIIKKYNSKNKSISGINIKGFRQKWKLHFIKSKLRSILHTYFIKQKNKIPFLIHWNNIYHLTLPILQEIRRKTTLYDNKVKYSPINRYLGAMLHDTNKNCIISDKLTNNSFIQRLQGKTDTIKYKLDIKLKNIGLNSRIPLIKSFFLAYTEIYGQILPTKYLKKSDKISLKNMKDLCSIETSHAVNREFRSFIGIPNPTQRWSLLKAMFHHKMRRNPDFTVLNHFISNYIDDDIPMFNELRKIRNNLFPNLEDEDYIKIKPKDFRHLCILKFTKQNIRKFNKYHPLRIINFVSNAYKAFNIIDLFNLKKVDSKIKQRDLTIYYELFYNSNYIHKHSKKNDKYTICNICNKTIKISIDFHVLCECPNLNKMRSHYWTLKHNEMVEVYNNLDHTHQMRFADKVFKVLRKINSK
ncbi:MAG: hypothetical protein GY932_14180, partial [Arcobacter sp.]|nr:hypothetical protein [Arcobacter sp.]